MGANIEREGDLVRIAIDGRLDSLSAGDISNQILENIKESDKCVIFDLSRLDYISSAGLQVLLLVAKQLKSGKVYIYKPTKMVDDVLKISGFYGFLSKTDSLEVD